MNFGISDAEGFLPPVPPYVYALSAYVATATPRLLAMSDDEHGRRPASGKWSPREIIGHLVDSASNNHQRFVRAQFQTDLVFPGYDQDAWVAAQCYQTAPWADLVGLWRTFNLHIARVMEAVPESERLRLRFPHNLHELAWQTIPESEPTTLDYFMADYVGHLQHHLRQIFGPMWPAAPLGPGYDSPEACALAGMARGCTVLASASEGDDGYVLLDAGTESHRYPYGVDVYRRNGRWYEGSSSNGSGWSSVTDDVLGTNLGTLTIWGDAPDGADLVRVAYRASRVEAPVQNGAYLAVWWRQPAIDDFPFVEAVRINGEWTDWIYDWFVRRPL